MGVGRLAGEGLALTVAVPKGRIFEDARNLLGRAGLGGVELLSDTRRLVWATDGGWRYLLARPHDVVTCVREGVADVGLVGKDVLMEDNDGVYEVLDLGIGVCRLSLAGPVALAASWREVVAALGNGLRVATRYRRAASEYFSRWGYAPRVIGLSGGVELAPQVGLADVIVDLVATGRTLRENGLVEYDLIEQITTRLVVNTVSFRWRSRAVEALCERLTRARPREYPQGETPYQRTESRPAVATPDRREKCDACCLP